MLKPSVETLQEALPCYFSSARATPWRRAGRRLEVSSGRLIIRAWPELRRSRTPLPGPRGVTTFDARPV